MNFRKRVWNFPWRIVRGIILFFRAFIKPYPRPESTPQAITQMDLNQVRNRLVDGGHRPHFEPWELASQPYEGVALNVRRPDGTETIDGNEVVMQFHIRAWETESGVEFNAGHREPSPLHHPRLHLEGVGKTEAGDQVRRALNDHDIGFIQPGAGQ